MKNYNDPSLPEEELLIQEDLVDENQREVFNENAKQSYWANVRKQFRKNKIAVWSLRVVYIIVFLAVFADFIANEKPIACGYQGNTYFPVFKEYAVDLGLSEWPVEFQNVSWKDLEYDWAFWPAVPYLPKNTDV